MRTVVIPFLSPAPLLRALRDVRSAVNRLIPDWRDHPDESRFDATRRTYPLLRAAYPHLASKWSLVACNETSATLASWDRLLRRTRRHDLRLHARLRVQLPRRRRLKASLHPAQYRLRGRTLDLTIRPGHHVGVDLSGVRNPLFERYFASSGGRFGLSVTDRFLLFHFHTPDEPRFALDSVGVDLNQPSADFVTSDGTFGAVDLRPICRVQGAMDRKRASIARHISKDLRHKRAVLRRYRRRERNRVDYLVHAAANEFLRRAGERNIIMEDLSNTTTDCMAETHGSERRRRLARWTHGAFQRIVTYKSRTQVVRVNPRGTSSDCPRCGGRLAHPSWRRATCANCQGDWHRDRMAAVAILSRGESVLRGAAHPPSALDALLETARWRPDDERRSGPMGESMKGDEAKGLIAKAVSQS
jgi:IS605 OrfB family transposase